MNILIKNIKALLPSAEGYSVADTNVCVSGDRILSVGDIPVGFIADKTISGASKLLIPGLSNAHTHAYMSVFRNIADDLSFDDWLFRNIMPMEDRMTKQEALAGNMLACVEMLKTGTTAYLDMGIFTGVSPEAALKTGMRAVVSRGLVGHGSDEAGRTRLDAAKAEMEAYKGQPLVSFMLAPHAIYTCDGDYLKIISAQAQRLGVPINIHLAETQTEFDTAVKEYGMTPTAYVESLGLFENKTVAAHCVYTTPEDMDILARHGVYVAHDPKSNLKLSNGIAPAFEMLRHGVRVCIGTDSAASNNTLNIFSDINYVALLHKGINHDPMAMTAAQVLRCAAENGADALGIDAGRIEPGRKSDLVIMDLNRPAFRPGNDYISALAYSACGYEVETVIINGDIVLENGVCTKVDEEEVYFNAEKAAEKMRSIR